MPITSANSKLVNCALRELQGELDHCLYKIDQHQQLLMENEECIDADAKAVFEDAYEDVIKVWQRVREYYASRIS